MRMQTAVLAGAALLLATGAGAGEKGQLRAIGEGRALYLANCASCHGTDARGGTAPDLGAIGTRDGSFRVLHVENHITGRRDGRDNGTMPCWGRLLVRKWPAGEGPATLQTWKLAQYLEFVQTTAAAESVAAVQPEK